ncbi:hypothetical protein PoB_002065800 [Plakobranchus ocellatus]|uniref:Uncharacterized protein n=1 Tax=Plakobranchus ocellatus TaxID=259542 RepID=A0AAV3ZHZ6_9GAST|nr:hypothetical protein PoB_002065800 [Plakobranchus ocellatus]
MNGFQERPTTLRIGAVAHLVGQLAAKVTASLAVVDDNDEGSGCHDCGWEVLSELSCWGSKETVKDSKFGTELPAEQRRELEELASCLISIFSDCPESMVLEEYRIKLTSSIPVRRSYLESYTVRQTQCEKLEVMENLGNHQ